MNRTGGRTKAESAEIAGVVHQNIRTMLQLRQQAEASQGYQYRLSNFITSRIGSLGFASVQAIFLGIWLLTNSKWIPGLPAFDPYPFTLLSTLLTVEGIFVAIFILLNQNLMADLERKREELDIQINLLTEHEVTQILSIVEKIYHHLDVKGKTVDLTDLKQPTSPEKVLQEIEKEIDKMEKN